MRRKDETRTGLGQGQRHLDTIRLRDIDKGFKGTRTKRRNDIHQDTIEQGEKHRGKKRNKKKTQRQRKTQRNMKKTTTK